MKIWPPPPLVKKSKFWIVDFLISWADPSAPPFGHFPLFGTFFNLMAPLSLLIVLEMEMQKVLFILIFSLANLLKITRLICTSSFSLFCKKLTLFSSDVTLCCCWLFLMIFTYSNVWILCVSSKTSFVLPGSHNEDKNV